MENERNNEINIFDILLILKKNIIGIIVVAMITAIAAYVYTVTMMVPLYRSSAHLLIKALTNDAMTVYTDSTSRTMLVNNCIEVLSGTEVMQDVVDSLKLDMSPEELQRSITISSPPDTQVLKINVIHYNPKTARQIASRMIEETEVALAKDVGVAALSIIQQPKTPMAPISPNPIKNTIMGGFLGAFAVAVLCILIRFINNKIYNADDIQRILGLTVFATVPHVEENTSVSQATDTPVTKEDK